MTNGENKPPTPFKALRDLHPRTRARQERYLRAFCAQVGPHALPATEEVIIKYLVDIAATMTEMTFKWSVHAIRRWHIEQGFADPLISSDASTRIRKIRARCRSPHRPELALDVLPQLCASLARTRVQIRDRAIILLAYAGGLKGSQIAALDVDDCAISPLGVRIYLKKIAKSIVLARYDNPIFCPTSAIEAWLRVRPKASGLPGPLFVGIKSTAAAKRISSANIHASVDMRLRLFGLKKPHLGLTGLRNSMVTVALRRQIDAFRVLKLSGYTDIRSIRSNNRPRP
jgi:site-specific recombinase XerC